MKARQISRRQVIKGAGAVGVLGALGVPTAVLADDGEEGRRVRWDLIKVVTTPLNCVSSGGSASASSGGGSKITITGSGTFPDVRNRCTKDVTGGGTWSIVAGSHPCFTGSGTFSVTQLLSWVPAAGQLPLPDCIAKQANASSGLAKLRVKYSNGKTGVLTVSCHLPVNSPQCMFEGITTSMEWEDFLNSEAPAAGKEGNRTIFHFLEGEED